VTSRGQPYCTRHINLELNNLECRKICVSEGRRVPAIGYHIKSW